MIKQISNYQAQKKKSDLGDIWKKSINVKDKID